MTIKFFNLFLIFGILIIGPKSFSAKEESIKWNCEKTFLKSQSFSSLKIKAEAFENVCFVKDIEDVYISELCLNSKMELIQCEALKQIENKKVKFQAGTNPMTQLCYEAGGTPASSEIKSENELITASFNRCLFAKDGSFLSFALMTLITD